ncbi:hypothetical protein [Methanobacterium sp.]|uniref:hypothetical protein n=1 Tax=Methanobacterium sp. TaxID=2164 RepID=UPI0025E38F10|nr:hypothetical protein [Methanobacterium sp.]MDY9922323.1 hypothetical protein [Methanobacterium sp.]
MKNLRCPKCGVEYPENSDRCQFCGYPKNPISFVNGENGKKIEIKSSIEKQQTSNSYLASKLIGLIGIIFFLPLAIASGLYLLTRKERSAKYWGLAFLIIGGIFWAIGIAMLYTMGYDKFMATYNLTNYSYDLTNYGLKF